jgi:EmrB/QacA subfamily drug resistance transporter
MSETPSDDARPVGSAAGTSAAAVGTSAQTVPLPRPAPGAWPALWSMIIGFFMILVDGTIVSVAMPRIATDFGRDVTDVIWVISAYLLAYAVPLLITGRLGDRFGPKRVYQVGLVVFTLSSLWCGLSSGLEMLIVARVAQGLGASLMSPQPMAAITRLFPARIRGGAMSVWGATAGVATLVGPLLGGVLVDGIDWPWIFFINVPVGVVALILAQRNVPQMSVHEHRFDVVGVLLSAAGMFLIVFGLEEGPTYSWGTIRGWLSVPLMLAAGLALMALFVLWQGVQKRTEPLVPLRLFTDRNFGLSNLAVATIGAAISTFALPLVTWAQTVHGFSPTQSALIMVPLAVVGGGLSPLVGKNLHRWNLRWTACAGIGFFALGLAVEGALLRTDPHWGWLALASVLMGIGNAGMWAPLSMLATRNLGPRDAGAGSGVFNTTRQIGAVLGSAAVAAMMSARISSEFAAVTRGSGAAGGHDGAGDGGSGTSLPDVLHLPFSHAMGDTLFLLTGILALGVIATLFLRNPNGVVTGPRGSHSS